MQPRRSFGMLRPLVSIIIDNHNYARYVGAAIESALAQTYPTIEIIVVDDGSTDGSRAVIAAYAGRLTIIFQDNRGQSGAFNTGYAASHGGIVLFLDSDDLLQPEAVAEIVAAWRPGTAKLQFCLATIDAEGSFTGAIFPNYPATLTPDSVRRETLRTALYPCPPTSGNAYASEFLAQVMPVPAVLAGADGPLNTLAPLYGDVVTLDRALARYRVHGANDGAQGALAADKFARFIRHDQHRAELLRQHAARRGYAVHGDPLDRAVLHLQYRLASLRLLPSHHPVPGERAAAVARRGVIAAWRAGKRLPARLFMMLWFLAVAGLPRGGAKRLIALRFVPASRPALLGAVLRRLGALRRTSDAAPSAAPAPSAR
jgi:glycosyltransferase involved in cell wall biosynthesis